MKLLLRFIFGIFLSAAFSAEATHIAGGQLTYKCLGEGRFEFTLIVIRDCGGNTANFSTSPIPLRGPHGTSSLSLIASFDASPRCANATAMACDPPSTGIGSVGAQSKFIFKGIVNLSSLAPAPLNVGYTFWVNFPCCRPTINNSLASHGTQVLIANMHRYTDPVTGNALTPAQLCDVSPDFLSDHSMVLLNMPNDTIRMQHSGFDRDIQDSLAYSITAPLNDQRVPYVYTSPYSLSNPIPGLLGPSAVGAANFPINPTNGEVVFTPSVLGNFTMPVKISAYRHGQLISEVIREQILRIVPYTIGTPPTIPGGAPLNFMQRGPQISTPASLSSNQQSFVWDFYARDFVQIALHATDYFPAFTGDPAVPSSWVPVLNPLRMAVIGPMMSTDHVTGLGCDLPPCARLRGYLDPMPPLPPASLPVLLQSGNGLGIGQGYAGVSETGAQFHWATSCAHIPDSTSQRVFPYHFRLIALDSACSLEGRNDATLTIRLHDLPEIPAPVLQALEFDTVRRQYTLRFSTQIDTTTVDPMDAANFPRLSATDLRARSVNRRILSFATYRIYRSFNAQGPWQLIRELSNPYASASLDTTVYATGHQVFYMMSAVSGCNENKEIFGNSLSASFTYTSVPQLSSGSSIQLVPNPGRDWYRLQGLEGTILPKAWQLRDMQGRVVKQIKVPESSASFAFDMSDLPAGVYLLQAAEVGTHFRLVHQPGQ